MCKKVKNKKGEGLTFFIRHVLFSSSVCDLNHLGCVTCVNEITAISSFVISPLATDSFRHDSNLRAKVDFNEGD